MLSDFQDGDAEEASEEHEEAQEGEGEEEQDDKAEGSYMDRSKKAKFRQMLAAGMLPSAVTEQWEQIVALKRNKRSKEAELVNSLFSRDSSGRLQPTYHDSFLRTEKAYLRHLCLHVISLSQSYVPSRL